MPRQSTLPTGREGLCILSLGKLLLYAITMPNHFVDAGGARGLSQLTILANLMNKINSECSNNDTKRPRDVFDVIGGTGTGG